MSSIERRAPGAIASPRRRALGFGIGALVLLGAIGAVLFWRKHHPIAGALTAGAGAALLALSLAAPAAALAVRRVWMTFAGAIGWVNARILLGVFFFVVLTPVALVRRLSGRETLRWRPGEGDGFWHAREKEYDPKHYEHPY